MTPNHGVGWLALTVEWIVAFGGAIVVAGAVARCASPWFLGVIVGSAVLFMPALLAALLLGEMTSTLCLGLAMLPILALGWRRFPPRVWQTARQLGGSRILIARTLMVPALAPSMLICVLLGILILGARWRLETRAPLMILPDPVTATG